MLPFIAITPSIVYRNTNTRGNTIKHNIRTSMNERIHFFIKIYLSHFIPERVMFFVCERWVGDRNRLLYWTKFFLRPYQQFFLFLAGVAQLWVTEGPKPSVCRWLSIRHLVPNWLGPSVHLVILLFDVHLLPLFFRLFTLAHLLIDGSVESQYITLGLLCLEVVAIDRFLSIGRIELFNIFKVQTITYAKLNCLK